MSRAAKLLRELTHDIDGDVAHHHACAFLYEKSCNRLADALCRTAHQGGLAFQLCHMLSTSCTSAVEAIACYDMQAQASSE